MSLQHPRVRAACEGALLIAFVLTLVGLGAAASCATRNSGITPAGDDDEPADDDGTADDEPAPADDGDEPPPARPDAGPDGAGGGQGGAAGMDAAAVDAERGTSFDARPATDVRPSAPGRSPGCGTPRTGGSSYVEQPRLTIAGLERQYWLYVPRTYDPTRAYPLVFRWHGAGGTALGGGMPIETAAGEDAIVVAAMGHDTPWGRGWDFAENGPDVALFDALVTRIGQSHCVDRGRIFSYGFSMGGGFSLILGCVRGEVLRGIGVVAGGWLPPAPRPSRCTGHVAAWIAQGSMDGIVTAAHAANIRDTVYLPQHGCMSSSRPVAPPPCRSYDGCLAGHPQVFCLSNVGHDVQAGFAPAAAWAFWSALPDADVP